MKLDSDYRIVRDRNSWNLVSLKNRNKVQYHPNLKQALLAYLHVCIKPPVTVEHVLETISAAEQRITNMLSGSSDEEPRESAGKGENNRD